MSEISLSTRTYAGTVCPRFPFQSGTGYNCLSADTKYFHFSCACAYDVQVHTHNITTQAQAQAQEEGKSYFFSCLRL